MRWLLGSELCQDCVDDEGGGGPGFDPSHGAACSWRQSRGFGEAPFCPFAQRLPRNMVGELPLPTAREIVGKRSSYHSPPPSLQPQEEPQEEMAFLNT